MRCKGKKSLFFRFYLNLRPLVCLLYIMEIRTDGRTDRTVVIGSPDGCQSRSDQHILDPCHFVRNGIFRLFCFNSTLWSPVALLYITRFDVQKFYVVSTWCIYVFDVDPGTNSDYFSYCTDGLIFISEAFCVYYAIRTGYFNVIHPSL